MDRVGVFYTVGFFILILVFFSFVVIMTKDFSSTTERLEESLGYEKIRNIDQSIQEGFRDIFVLTSGITVTKGLNKITFREILTNPSSSNFKGNVSKYESFLESNYPVDFDAETINNTLSLVIRPHNIVLGHPSYGDEGMNVTWDEVNFVGFNVTIQTNVLLGAASCVASGSFTAIYFRVEALGTSGSSCSSEGDSNVEIYDSDIAILQATLDLDETLRVLNITVSNSPITVTVDVEGLLATDEETIVTLPDNILNYNFEDLNFIKNGTIRVL